MTVPDLRARFTQRRAGAAPRPDCPDADAIWKAVAGEAPHAELTQLLDHSALCPACAAAWRLAREMGADQAGVAPRAATRPSRGAWLPIAAAAALLLAAGLALQRLPDWRPGLSGNASMRSLAAEPLASLIGDEATLPRATCVLTWSAGPPGTRYSVRVLDSDLNIIDRAGALESATYQVPPAKLASLRAGTRLHWQVEALLPDGGRAVSPTYSIRLE